MAVNIPRQTYTGRIKEILVGDGAKAFRVGGESSYPFHLFEGDLPNEPRIALEVNDIPPADWPEAVLEPYKDVVTDPGAWAKKCVELYGADAIHIELVGTNPNGENLSAEHAVAAVKKVADAVDVPVAVWGSGDVEKDAVVLRAVAEAFQKRRLMIGPIQEGNYKQIGAMVIAYNHTAVASTPIDINLAKQLNVLLGNLGVQDGAILMDPTVGGLGYGLEYTYSVMERARMAALVQQDEKLQFPLYCNAGREIWKVKEAKVAEAESKSLGDARERGINMEVIMGAALLVAGADVLVTRHPESARLIRKLAAGLKSN